MDYKKTYEQSFENTNYNLHSDQEFRFQYVINALHQIKAGSVIDISSGRGNLINVIKNFDPKISVTSTDLKKFHNYDVPFFEVNLCEPETFKNIEPNKFDLLTCLDVMEHIEKGCIENVLRTFSEISRFSVLTIANHSDILNGVELHIIQENLTYWKPIISKYFVILDQQEHYNGRLYLFTLKSKTNE
jgi:hypothetical protein